jgi:hypothetical protein
MSYWCVVPEEEPFVVRNIAFLFGLPSVRRKRERGLRLHRKAFMYKHTKPRYAVDHCVFYPHTDYFGAIYLTFLVPFLSVREKECPRSYNDATNPLRSEDYTLPTADMENFLCFRYVNVSLVGCNTVLIRRFQRFKWTHHIHLQGWSDFIPAGVGSIFLWKVGICLHFHTTSKPRRPKSTASLLSEQSQSCIKTKYS